jgi:signal recognition particle receptor subunit beta
MPIVDHAARLITCKLVLYGPGRSGKTTNLTWLHAALPSSQVGALTSVATRHGRTHAFEYRPDESAVVGAFRVGFEVRTMSGEARSSAAREALLEGADGVAFIADSQRDRASDNLASLQEVYRILSLQSVDAHILPMVLQYNKQDLPLEERWSPAEMARQLNARALIEVPAQACHGIGVRETVEALSTRVLAHLGVRSPTLRWAA